MDLERLQAGSYKGVPFLCLSGSVAGGNKNVIHSYPNSNRQTVENLGQTPRSYPLNIVLRSANYEENRDALLSALEDGTSGPLIHPFYGRIDDVIAGPYTLNEAMAELGDSRLTVTFYVDNGPGIPQKARTTVNSVVRAKDTTVVALTTNFTGNYTVTPGFIGNFTAALEKLQDLSLTLKDVQKPLDTVGDFITVIESLSSEAAALIRVPMNLANRLTDIFESVLSVFDEPADALNYYERLFDFGDDDEYRTPITAGQIERRKSAVVLNNTVQFQALVSAYVAAVQTEYVTVTDVDDVTERLDTQFYKLQAAQEIDDVTKGLLADVRADALAYFDEAKLTAKRLVTVETNLTSARLLAFTYYADSSQGELLAQLNGIEDVNHVEGTVQVITT